MRENIWKLSKYLLLFCLFLISFLFLPGMATDEIWSYGFAYNIANGLIPYRDFNMIVPPVFAIIFSFFLIFSKGIIMFHIGQAFMMTFLSYLLEKLLKEKSWFAILLLLITTPMIYNMPSYNTLCFLWMIILVFLEKNDKNDWGIGIILGLSLLTKQTIGLMLVITSIYLVKNNQTKLRKRLLGLFLPLLIFILYTIFTDCFFEFVDQCILGMFDFCNNITIGFHLYKPLGLIALFCLFIYYYKNKMTTEWYYALAFFSICFPLMEQSHVLLGLFSLLVIALATTTWTIQKQLKHALIIMIVTIPLLTCYLTIKKDPVYPNTIPNLEYRYLDKTYRNNLKTLSTYAKKTQADEIIILQCSAYLFKLTNHLPINKLDLINVGNWGREGSKKIIKELKKKAKDNTLILLNPNELKLDTQLDKEVIKYVMKYGKKVDKVLSFDVYKL